MAGRLFPPGAGDARGRWGWPGWMRGVRQTRGLSPDLRGGEHRPGGRPRQGQGVAPWNARGQEVHRPESLSPGGRASGRSSRPGQQQHRVRSSSGQPAGAGEGTIISRSRNAFLIRLVTAVTLLVSLLGPLVTAPQVAQAAGTAGTLTIKKVTNPNPDPFDQSFTFSVSRSGETIPNFNLKNGDSKSIDMNASNNSTSDRRVCRHREHPPPAGR